MAPGPSVPRPGSAARPARAPQEGCAPSGAECLVGLDPSIRASAGSAAAHEAMTAFFDLRCAELPTDGARWAVAAPPASEWRTMGTTGMTQDSRARHAARTPSLTRNGCTPGALRLMRALPRKWRNWQTRRIQDPPRRPSQAA